MLVAMAVALPAAPVEGVPISPWGIEPAFPPRAEALATRLRELSAVSTTILEVESLAGGGSLPDQALKSVAVALSVSSAGEEALAACRPPARAWP